MNKSGFTTQNPSPHPACCSSFFVRLEPLLDSLLCLSPSGAFGARTPNGLFATRRAWRLASPKRFQRSSISVRVWLFCIALAKACELQVCEIEWKIVFFFEEKQHPGPWHLCHQSDLQGGRDWWRSCCVALHWPEPAGSKLWNLINIINRTWESAFRRSKTLGLNTNVTNLILSKPENSECGVHLKHLSQCLQERAIWQSKEFSAKKTFRKQSQSAFAPTSLIPFHLRSISVMELLIFKASATASAPHHLSLPQRGSTSTEEVEVENTAAASTSAAPKQVPKASEPKLVSKRVPKPSEPSWESWPRRSTVGRLSSFSCLARSSFWASRSRSRRRQEISGEFLTKWVISCDCWWCSMVSEWNMKPIFELSIVSTKTTISWWDSFQVKTNYKCTMWDISICMVATDTPACWFPYPPSIVECLSLIRATPVNKSAKSQGGSCCSSAFVASNKKNTSGLGLCYLGISPYHSTCSFPNSSRNMFMPEIFWFHWIGTYSIWNCHLIPPFVILSSPLWSPIFPARLHLKVLER